MKKFVNRTSMGYYGLIILILFYTILVSGISLELDLMIMFGTSAEQVLEKFYMSQLIVFMMNSFAFVYLIGSVYHHTFTSTNLSFLLAGTETKEDIKKYLFKRALIPYLIITCIDILFFYSKFKKILWHYPDAVISSAQLMILLCIFCITIVSMLVYYKTDKIFRVSTETKVIQYVIFGFGFSYIPMTLNDISYSIRWIAFLLFVLIMIATNIMYYVEIKSNKKIDIC